MISDHKIEEYRKYWNEAPGYDSHKILALLRKHFEVTSFLPMGFYSLVQPYLSNYKNISVDIVKKYEEKESYLEYLWNGVMCTPEFIVFLLWIKTPLDKVRTEDPDLAAIFEVIRQESNIDIYHQFSTKSYFVPDFYELAYKYELLSHKDFILFNFAHDNKMNNRLLDLNGIFKNKDEQWLFKMKPDEIKELFKLALRYKNFNIAKYLFCKFHSLPFSNQTSHFNLKSMVGELLPLNKKVSNDLILELIDSMKDNLADKPEAFNNFFYLKLSDENANIACFKEVETSFLQKFKLNFDKLFFEAVKNGLPTAAEYILTKTPSQNAMFWFYDPVKQVCSFNKTDEAHVKINCLQGALIIARNFGHDLIIDTKRFGNCRHVNNLGNQFMNFLFTIKLLVDNNPKLAEMRDSRGDNCWEYFLPLDKVVNQIKDSLPESISVAYQDFYNLISKINYRQRTQNAFTFFLAGKDDASLVKQILPEEIQQAIEIIFLKL